MEQPLISIIVPVYNAEPYLDNCLDSIAAQTWENLEVWLVDDGSTDASPALCDARAAADSRFHVLHQANAGVSAARNAALERATGQYLQFVDGDDYLPSTATERLVRTAGATGADLVIGSRFLEKTNGFQSTFMRRVGITWLSAMLKLCTGHRVSDPTSGFRACGRRAIDLFCASYPVDYPEPESIAVAIKSGLSVKEVSVEMRERQGGTSSIGGLSSVYYMLKVSLAILIASASRRSK